MSNNLSSEQFSPLWITIDDTPDSETQPLKAEYPELEEELEWSLLRDDEESWDDITSRGFDAERVAPVLSVHAEKFNITDKDRVVWMETYLDLYFRKPGKEVPFLEEDYWPSITSYKPSVRLVPRIKDFCQKFGISLEGIDFETITYRDK